MFIRKKPNRSGTTSVQIIEKRQGKSIVVKSLGSSSKPAIIEQLFQSGLEEVRKISGLLEFNFAIDQEREIINTFFNGIKSIRLMGPELLLGKIFDSIGFNKIPEELFRYLVITRLVYPVSKLKTVDYLYKYKGISLQVDKIYRYLDKLHEDKIAQVQQIGYEHALKITNDNMSIVFYDVTTLYFEAEEEDDLRKTGFSKDGKHKNPQIVLALIVNSMGFPLGYEIFEGNKFEGHTMLPVLEAFKSRYKIEKLVVVADAGLMSNKNIEELIEKKYAFIIGARIKTETEKLKEKIVGLQLTDEQSAVIKKGQKLKLIVSYSLQRAKKDEHNRKRGLKKLEKLAQSGRLTKQQISNRGYNRYLTLTGETKISIDYEKFKTDSRWDGLKGYLTNTDLSKQEVIEQYGQLWKIEKAFRISKTDLRIRPIYHHLKRRIEAHISIAFAACTVYKELERLLNQKKSALSPGKIIDILKTIYDLTILTPFSKTHYTRLVITTEEQREALNLFQIDFGCPNA